MNKIYCERKTVIKVKNEHSYYLNHCLFFGKKYFDYLRRRNHTTIIHTEVVPNEKMFFKLVILKKSLLHIAKNIEILTWF